MTEIESELYSIVLIKESGNDIRKGQVYNPRHSVKVISALKYAARSAVLVALSLRPIQTQACQNHLFTYIQNLDDTGCVFKTLSVQNALISNHMSKEEQLPRIIWNDTRNDELCVGGCIISINWLRDLVSNLEYSATTILRDELLFVDTLPDMNLKSWIDDLQLTTVGYSVFGVKSSECFDLKNHIDQIGAWAGPPALPIHCKKYLDAISRFQQCLYPLIHMTLGGTARCTELLSVLYTNTNLKMRNVFVINGLICLIIAYNKTNQITQQDRVIARFLPKRISELVAIYLTCVKQVEM